MRDNNNTATTNSSNNEVKTNNGKNDEQQKNANNNNNNNTNFKYEFGGPIGTTITTLILPIIVLLLGYWSKIGYVDLNILLNDFLYKPFWDAYIENPILCPCCLQIKDYFFINGNKNNNDVENYEKIILLLQCFCIIISWFIFQVILERILPCEIIYGVQLPNTGERLPYRINGHLSLWVTILILLIGWPTIIDGRLQFISFPYYSFLYNNFNELAFVTIILCYITNTYLYINSFRLKNGKERILAKGGNSGNIIYDYFMGRELNPRIGTFDWKEFCELRPGLIGWLIINCSCIYEQKVHLGYVSYSMILINIVQFIYIWDALYQEKSILTTMDITTDGFGFMLLFGDLCWVPYTYSLQSRYLVYNDPQLSILSCIIIIIIHIFGYYIFRSANGQKDAFRRNPNANEVQHLKYITTKKRGTKLLISGWWGLARKINYTGDYIMGLSWCLLCGFNSIVPYYYSIYFIILLIHRSIRDDHICYEKYGDDWDKYKQLVPYKFIPGIV